MRWLVISALAGSLGTLVPCDDIPARFEAQQDARRDQLERDQEMFQMHVAFAMQALGLAHVPHSHCCIPRAGVIAISEACKRNALAKECM